MKNFKLLERAKVIILACVFALISTHAAAFHFKIEVFDAHTQQILKDQGIEIYFKFSDESDWRYAGTYSSKRDGAWIFVESLGAKGHPGRRNQVFSMKKAESKYHRQPVVDLKLEANGYRNWIQKRIDLKKEGLYIQ